MVITGLEITNNAEELSASPPFLSRFDLCPLAPHRPVSLFTYFPRYAYLSRIYPVPSPIEPLTLSPIVYELSKAVVRRKEGIR